MIKNKSLSNFSSILLVIAVFNLTACSSFNQRFPRLNLPHYKLTTTGVGATAGTALGGGVGAVIGSASGNVGEGALLGALSGGTAGAVIANQVERGKETLKRQYGEIQKQDSEIKRLNTEIEELRSLSLDSARGSMKSRAFKKPRNVSSKSAAIKKPSSFSNTQVASKSSASSIPVYKADVGQQALQGYLAKVPVRTGRTEAEPVNLKKSYDPSKYRKIEPTSVYNTRISSKPKTYRSPYSAGQGKAGQGTPSSQIAKLKEATINKPSAELPTNSYKQVKEPVQVASLSNKALGNTQAIKKVKKISSLGDKLNSIEKEDLLNTSKPEVNLPLSNSKELSIKSESLKDSFSKSASNRLEGSNRASEGKKLELVNIQPDTIRKVDKTGSISEQVNKSATSLSSNSLENNSLSPAKTSGLNKSALKEKGSGTSQAAAYVPSSSKKHTSPSCLEAENEASRARQASSDADKLFYFRRALRLCGESSNFHFETGKAYLAIGREEDAAFEFRAAVELDSQNQAAKQMLTSLGQ